MSTPITYSWEHDDLVRLMLVVQDIAYKAGDLIMEFYRAAANDENVLGTELKDNGTPVTNADLGSDAIIIAGLQALTPGISVVTEENGEQPDGDIYWVVDPLDGTKEFQNRTGGFAVKIALIQNGQPILGLVYAPAFDTLYHSVKDGKSFKQENRGADIQISVDDGPKPGKELHTLFNGMHGDMGLYHKYRLLFENHHNLKLPAVPDAVPNLPRAMRIAEGLADAFVKTEISMKSINGYPLAFECSGYTWDEAADRLILENAGGVMVSLHDGQPPDFPEPRGRTAPYIAFRNKKLGKRIAAALQNNCQ